MEELYWKQFTETGAVTDYLGYKMERYGHCDMSSRGNVKEKEGYSVESDCIDRNGAFDNTDRRI